MKTRSLGNEDLQRVRGGQTALVVTPAPEPAAAADPPGTGKTLSAGLLASTLR